MALGNHPSQIDGITNYGRLKFNTDLFKGEGPYELERRSVVTLLNSVPIPSQGNFLFTDHQFSVALEVLRKRPSIRSILSMPKIGKLMDNIDRWYQYWNTHAKIDLEILHHEGKLLRFPFVFPLFLLYVEMIISIIPFKKELPLGVELDYPQEMRNAINSYHKFNILMQTPPDNEESQSCIENQILFKERLFRSKTRPCAILWTFIEFWIKSHYTGFWSEVKEYSGFHACHAVKIFFNSIFTNGIETLNEKLRDHLPHE
ncbi:uncharacterized protein VP01_6733g1 [Puccinia sorghi]|uniref:Uncharacterized protein n=1 Tax=Puccinia sorghi TaxID=27349 RepID=A0A0L6UFK3_9BASI|nr:uncharacterized protein VP01_6733g1 [Puccinia sorghi]